MNILLNQEAVSYEQGSELCLRGEPGIVVVISRPRLERTIHLFDNQTNYREWVTESDFAPAFLAADLLVNVEAEFGRIPQVDALTPRADSIAVVYSSEGYRGRWGVVDQQCYQNLSQIGFYDNIQSLRVTGSCLLTDEPNFQGRRLYIVGEGLCEIPELSSLGFGSKTASLLAF